ncbi:hypothetical protein E1287_33865 [Actinomadura sp. KC06]|uniref:AMP-binding protein n=1 Tax=Actinomadura sp. KC06 TaxID=2530369 RepID=UPI0010518319|nr:AMP-binding protein [Actinomadura sp. KC06]TDD27804.1 hypothetical protein E1287_33865 [Actinomadura sp. KC06]
MNIPTQVLRQAARAPELVAVEDDMGALSYRDLVGQALSGARVLGACGPPGSPVAVRVPPGRDLIIVALAAMLASRPYLPLDPNEPSRRALAFLHDTKISTLVGAAPEGAAVTALPPSALHGHDLADPVTGPVAYVVRTSGSTGVPKGVVVPHGGLTNLVSWHNRTYASGPGIRQLQTANPGFDAAVWEIWPSLCAGGTLVIAPQGIRLSPVSIVDFARQHAINLLFAPTPIAEMIVDLDQDDAVACLTLLTGGDRLRLRRIPRTWQIVNHYGPAEATVVTTWHPVTEPPAKGIPAIGRPIDGVRIAMRGPDGIPTAPGDTGEIFISGRGLASGYHGRQADTDKVFGALSDLPGRWYRTGDLVSLDAQGDLHFQGRVNDDQVNIRGVRIEVGEVEAALTRHPAIREAVVAPVGPIGIFGGLLDQGRCEPCLVGVLMCRARDRKTELVRVRRHEAVPRVVEEQDVFGGCRGLTQRTGDGSRIVLIHQADAVFRPQAPKLGIAEQFLYSTDIAGRCRNVLQASSVGAGADEDHARSVRVRKPGNHHGRS